MPMWEIQVEINSTGRVLMHGPSEEAIREVIQNTPKKDIVSHIRDRISFITINEDSIRRIDEEDGTFRATSPDDGVLRDEQATPEGERRRDDNVDGDRPSGEPSVVEEEHSGDDERGEPVGEVQPDGDPSQVARPVGANGPSGVRGDPNEASASPESQDSPLPSKDATSGGAGERVSEVLPEVL